MAYVLAGCSHSATDEPDIDQASKSRHITQIRVVGPYNATYRFSYDADGRIIRMTLNPDRRSYFRETEVEYIYPGNDYILANYREYDGNSTIYMSDTLILENGLITSTHGIYSVEHSDQYTDYFRRRLKKIHYNERKQMTVIEHEQLRGLYDTPNYPQKPWLWNDTLAWNGDKLLTIKKTNGAKYVTEIIDYNYGWEIITSPVIFPSMDFMHHYPLMAAGYFGALPSLPIIQCSYSDKHNHLQDTTPLTYSYKYTISDGEIISFERKNATEPVSYSTFYYNITHE